MRILIYQICFILIVIFSNFESFNLDELCKPFYLSEYDQHLDPRVDTELLFQFIDMGFSRQDVISALVLTSNEFEATLEKLINGKEYKKLMKIETEKKKKCMLFF